MEYKQCCKMLNMGKIELLKYGIKVFNYEKSKFKTWLKRKNISMGGAIPYDIINTVDGRKLIFNCLNRIEYGNFS